jgi:HlyD family secretion protein
MEPHGTDDIQRTLGVGRERARLWRKRLSLLSLFLLATMGVAALVRAQRRELPTAYKTTTASKGSLTVTVTATGSLESVTQVKVGTEISGIVEKVYADYNTVVKVGQLLATINTAKLRAQRGQAQGALDAARAKQVQAGATLAESKAQLERLRQVRELSGGKVPSQQELDTQDATVKRADADLASANAQVVQARANADAFDTDIKKADISSPINGIVLDRQVDPGQTVAASFQTPTLFTLAEDLTRMKLIVDVDEADVGKIRTGQSGSFRVDAYPERRFDSRVTDVRSTPKTSNGVVTYQTVLSVDNSEQLLKPGMTATAEIVVMNITDAVLVPNAALRFTPPETPQRSGGLLTSLIPRPPEQVRRTDPGTDRVHQRVWTIDAQLRAAPVNVTVGSSNGRVTQVVSGDVTPGMTLITGTVDMRK